MGILADIVGNQFQNLKNSVSNTNTPDGLQKSDSGINLTDTILPRDLDIYAEYIFKKKKDSHGFNLIHNWTKQTQSGYEICFIDPFSDEEIILTDKDIPVYLDQVDESQFVDSYDKISKYEGLHDDSGVEVDLDNLRDKLEPSVTFDPLVAEAVERVKKRVVVDNTTQQSGVPSVPQMMYNQPANSPQGFNILSKIKKTNQSIKLDILMPNLELIRTIMDNLETDDVETNKYIVDTIIYENHQNFIEQIKIFIKSELNIKDIEDEVSIDESNEKED